MSRQTLGLRVAGAVFGIVAAGHLLWLATRADIAIAGWAVPVALVAVPPLAGASAASATPGRLPLSAIANAKTAGVAAEFIRIALTSSPP